MTKFDEQYQELVNKTLKMHRRQLDKIEIFEHDSDSAKSIANDLKQLRTGDLIKAFYQFREEMLSAIAWKINLDPMTIELSDDCGIKTMSVFQLLRECERRGLALDKF